MKKIFIKSVVILIPLTFFLVPLTLIYAQYIPIVDLPGVPSTGIDTKSPDALGKYLNSLFKIFVSIAAILGVIKLITCGLQYMMSESISTKEGAKKCIWSVLGGLALILLSVLILQIINPRLTEFDFGTISTGLIQKGSGTGTGKQKIKPGVKNTPLEKTQRTYTGGGVGCYNEFGKRVNPKPPGC